MPTISLRLTDEELAALRAWAHDSRRSLQKELIWRLFADEEKRRAIAAVLSSNDPETKAAVSDILSQVPDLHFKPDPK